MTTIQTITWRTFLDDHCRRMKADEKQAFAAHLGVSKTTINRWRRGKDSPKAKNLERMLSIFPENQKQQFLVLLRRDAKTWSLLPTDVQKAYPLELQHNEREEQNSRFQLGMLNHFCLNILRLQRDTSDRFWQVSGAVLREALTQLETYPERTGLEIVIAKCMPPKNEKVRSLRMLVGMGTPPWRGDLHYKDFFLGAADLAGYAIANRHGEMIPDFAEDSLPVPVRPIEQARSAAAFPIMQEHCIAGALLISSTQPQYFTQERLTLLETFADLIRLAFYDERDFYPISSIDLGLTPPLTVQRAHFASLRQRVENEYRQVSRSEASSMQELMRVEERVRRQIEDELLRIAVSDETITI